MSERLLEVESTNAEGHREHFYIPYVSHFSQVYFVLFTACLNCHAISCLDRYDKLVIAVGSVSATKGVQGLQHCFQLKTVGDAQHIRQRILGMP